VLLFKNNMNIKILKFLFIGILFFTLILNPLALKAEEKIPVYFFYGIGCPHCANVAPFLEKISNNYPQIIIYGLEIYQNQENGMALLSMYKKYNVPQKEQGVPVIFLPDKYLSGDTPIINNLENEFKRIIKTYLPVSDNTLSLNNIPSSDNTPAENNIPTVEAPKDNETKTQISNKPSKSLSLFAITIAALADSINPCAIAVLVILLSALMLINDRKRALYGGLAFIASIYISYFLFGLGILKAIQTANINAHIVYRIVGVLAIFIGLANLKDFFWYGKGFVMEIPRKWRPVLQAMLKKITSPIGAFLIGFVVTLFELPCTGGPYFFVLGLLSQQESLSIIIPDLLYYNIFFILPLLILAFIIYFGYSNTEKAKEWKEKNIRALHLITGLIMLGLGIWVFFY